MSELLGVWSEKLLGIYCLLESAFELVGYILELCFLWVGGRGRGDTVEVDEGDWLRLMRFWSLLGAGKFFWNLGFGNPELMLKCVCSKPVGWMELVQEQAIVRYQ